MKILIVTPLYPPDIASHAPYVKDLAFRLKSSHTVSILTYNFIPEKIEGVTIHTIQKRLSTPIRIFKFTKLLFALAKENDLLYIQNGPSVELPLMLVSLLNKIPYFVRDGDPQASSFAQSHSWYKNLHSFVKRNAKGIVCHTEKQNGLFVLTNKAEGLLKPEIIPYEEKPLQAIAQYEENWYAHLLELDELFNTTI